MYDVAIVGAGISGLTCGCELKRAGLKIAVIEATHIGGTMRSHRIGPYLLESGPNSLRGNSKELIDLIKNLGLEDQIVGSSDVAKQRYLYRAGKLIAVPSLPPAALSSPLIPFSEKLKLLREPFVTKGTTEDESIRHFISRRTSEWLADNIVDPIIAGIYAGDIVKLSMRSSFPKFWAMEREHGSLIKGAIRAKKNAPRTTDTQKQPGIFSFNDGLQTLIDALKHKLEGAIVEGFPVTHIEKSKHGYHLVGPNLEAKIVILATPAYRASELIQPFSRGLAESLESIEHPHVAVVSLAFKRDNVEHPLDGFGYLVPSNQNRDILGCIFSSSLWKDRAPEDEALLTIMIGGSKQPKMQDWTDEQILEVAELEVRRTLSISGASIFHHVTRWPKAIPQYHLGYHKIMDEIEAFEQKHPGIHLLSNYRGGVAIGSCVTNATELAGRLVQQHTH